MSLYLPKEWVVCRSGYLPDLFPQNLDMDFAVAWTIKLAKENPLPGSQNKFSILDNQVHRGANQSRLDVAIAVAFAMEESRLDSGNGALHP